MLERSDSNQTFFSGDYLALKGRYISSLNFAELGFNGISYTAKLRRAGPGKWS